MGKRKKRGRKMPKWKKWARAIIGTVGTGVGAAIAFSPTYRGLRTAIGGDPQLGFREIVFDTTGINPGEPAFKPDINKVIGFGITLGVGIGIMQLFKYFAKRV